VSSPSPDASESRAFCTATSKLESSLELARVCSNSRSAFASNRPIASRVLFSWGNNSALYTSPDVSPVLSTSPDPSSKSSYSPLGIRRIFTFMFSISLSKLPKCQRTTRRRPPTQLSTIHPLFPSGKKRPFWQSSGYGILSAGYEGVRDNLLGQPRTHRDSQR